MSSTNPYRKTEIDSRETNIYQKAEYDPEEYKSPYQKPQAASGHHAGGSKAAKQPQSKLEKPTKLASAHNPHKFGGFQFSRGPF